MKQKKSYVEIERIDSFNILISIVLYPFILFVDLLIIIFSIILSFLPIVNYSLLSFFYGLNESEFFNFNWLKRKEKIYVENEN